MLESDVEFVEWLARVKVATVEQVSKRMGWKRAWCFRRLKACCEAGLIEADRESYAATVWFAKHKGLRAVGSPLSQARVRTTIIVHDLAATDAAILLENLGLTVLTEREIRACMRLDDHASYVVNCTGPNGRRSVHTPDLAIHGPDGRWIAVEVELTAKTVQRTKAILGGYNNHGEDLAGVLYLVNDQANCQRMHRLAQASWMLTPFDCVTRHDASAIEAAIRTILTASVRSIAA